MNLETHALKMFKFLVDLSSGYVSDKFTLQDYLAWRQSVENNTIKLKRKNIFRPFNPIMGESPLYLDFVLTIMKQKNLQQMTKQQFHDEVVANIDSIYDKVKPIMLQVATIDKLMLKAKNNREFKILKAKQDLLWQKICKPFGGFKTTIKQDEADSVQIF